jgi:hypothetical protein
MARDYSRRLPAGTKVSAGTPIGRSVTAHFPLVRDFKSAVRGRPGLGVSTGPVLQPDPMGKAAMGTGVGKISTGLLPSELGMAGAVARTIIVEFWQGDVSYSGGKCVFSFGDSSARPRTQFTLLTATAFRRIQLATYSQDFNYDLWSQSGTYARVFLGITYDGGTQIKIRSHCRVFLNDGTPQGVVSRSFTSTLSGPLATGDTIPLDLMGGGTYGFQSMNAQLFNATFIGGRALAEREIDNFYRNPQQIMAAPPVFPYSRLAPVTTTPPLNLVGTDGSQGATGTSGTITQAQNLGGTNGAIANTGSAGAIGQEQNLAGSDGNQDNTGTGGAVDIVAQQQVQGTDGEQGNSGTGGAITQAQNLGGSNGTQSNEGDSAEVTSNVDKRYGRPAEDVLQIGTPGVWLPSAGNSLAAMLSEPSADATTYIRASTPGLCEVLLNPVFDPGTDEGHVMRYQVWSDTGDGIVVRLMQGNRQIAEWVHATLPATPTIYAQRLTLAQAASITNYSDLRHQFEAL